MINLGLRDFYNLSKRGEILVQFEKNCVKGLNQLRTTTTKIDRLVSPQELVLS